MMPEQNVEVQPSPVSEPENGRAQIEVKPRTDAAAQAKSNGEVEPNYQYWRDNGGGWIDEYDQRKKTQVLYHIQELMLTQYMLQHAATAPQRPMKVFEYGCGVGRHLANLTRLPNVDAYGYDQSHTMAAGVLRWSGKAWFDSHITVGMPTGTLPYPDQSFDICYTAEVLVHVRPEHLDGILRELVRVCRGHILHMETSEHLQLVSDSHDGCWRHDMVAAYARLGLDCQILPSGYFAHSPYRVKVLEEPRFTWAPSIIEMYRRMERDINAGFEAAAINAHNQQAQLQQQHALAQQQLQQQQSVLQQQLAELNALLAQRARELDAARAAIATHHAEATAHAARAGSLASELETSQASGRALQALADQLERTIADLQKETAALATRASELEKLWEIERNTALTLAGQRRTFVESVKRHLRP
jgi:SAM-dependent methyltransferase